MKHWLETRQVLDRLAELSTAGRRAALATVINVKGSAYRHEGAKMLVAEDGSSVGNVSGGCLEQDVREVALRVIRSGTSELRSYCSGSDEVEAWDLGLGCDGQVDVFVEPVSAARSDERGLLDGRRAFAACSVIKGPDALAERRMVVTAAAVNGSLEAGLDGRVVGRARERLHTGEPGVDQVAGHTVFIDVLQPPPQLALFGAGDDAIPLARFAADAGFRVIVVDYRHGYLTRERFPHAAALVATDASGGLGEVGLDDDSFAVVMTHNFAHDQAYVAALLKTPAPYVGMLGPRARRERIVQSLEITGALPRDHAERLFGPVGLDIGTDGAEQVALSVIAEVLAIRSGRAARSLRDRSAPIHAET
jgi:xanthine/CO dehydrogenase XdhC/CoxF family maturation factor